jgi:hypothetical protein
VNYAEGVQAATSVTGGFWVGPGQLPETRRDESGPWRARPQALLRLVQRGYSLLPLGVVRRE